MVIRPTPIPDIRLVADGGASALTISMGSVDLVNGSHEVCMLSEDTA